jgi:hypothetical protein
MITSIMYVAVILEATDVNDVCGYYHYSDEPNFTNDYCENQPRYYL